MDQRISAARKKAFSDHDLRRMTEGQAKILMYHELSRYKSLNELLGDLGAVILLYETRKNYGHWVSLLRIGERSVEYFDSYGRPPDFPFKYIDPEFAVASGQRASKNAMPWLSALIQNSYMLEELDDVIWNDVKLQRMEHDMSTCGRWVASRILDSDDYDLSDFVRLYTGPPKQRHRPDWYVVATTLYG